MKEYIYSLITSDLFYCGAFFGCFLSCLSEMYFCLIDKLFPNREK